MKSTYAKFLNGSDAMATFFLFGHEDGVGFIRKLDWDKDEFEVIDYGPSSVVAGGYYDETFEAIAKSELGKFKTGVEIQINYWSQHVMVEIINKSLVLAQIEELATNPVSFPLDQVIIRVNATPYYERCNYIIDGLDLRIPTEGIVPMINNKNSFTVQI